MGGEEEQLDFPFKARVIANYKDSEENPDVLELVLNQIVIITGKADGNYYLGRYELADNLGANNCEKYVLQKAVERLPSAKKVLQG